MNVRLKMMNKMNLIFSALSELRIKRKKDRKQK